MSCARWRLYAQQKYLDLGNGILNSDDNGTHGHEIFSMRSAQDVISRFFPFFS